MSLVTQKRGRMTGSGLSHDSHHSKLRGVNTRARQIPTTGFGLLAQLLEGRHDAVRRSAADAVETDVLLPRSNHSRFDIGTGNVATT